ncbi:hypothetical protein [Salinarimonas ramus]|uniref:Lipoprotein n=1 Tax=Salinarimonas ramus TaxID=690164 RepID=A0A917Q4Y2_9HYPH|nr:hypothetical protein [Salinarimonas ramus]GGK22967.1 hypothetical protein GCM10011322_07160 [Salinarimonas ramus]
MSPVTSRARFARALLVVLFLPALLAACAGISPSGLVAAARLDPLNSDPGAITVGVGLPETIRLRDGDAILRIAFTREGADEAVVDEAVPLAVAEGASRADAPRAEPGERIFLAGVAADDAARFRAAQARIRALRAQGVRGSGSLTVTVRAGCRTGEVPDTLPTRTFLRTSPDAGFATLTRSPDLFALLGEEAARGLRERLVPC